MNNFLNFIAEFFKYIPEKKYNFGLANNDTQNNSNNVNNNNSNNNASSNNSSSNNSSNSSNNNSNSGNSSNNAINNSSNNNANTINEKKAIYSISGKAWIDANKSGKFVKSKLNWLKM